LASRKLAFWLLQNPEYAPMSMPSITFRGELAEKSLAEFLSYTPTFVPANRPIPPGMVEEGELMGTIERVSWLTSFRKERGGPIYSRTVSREDKPALLADLLARFKQSRARLWSTKTVTMPNGTKTHRNKWWRCPPITDSMLAAYSPPKRCYEVSLPRTPLTDLRALGCFPAIYPSLPVGEREGSARPLDTAIDECEMEIFHNHPELDPEFEGDDVGPELIRLQRMFATFPLEQQLAAAAGLARA